MNISSKWWMKGKGRIFLLFLLLSVLFIPHANAGIGADGGDTIRTPAGSTTMVITIMDMGMPAGEQITIDTFSIAFYLQSGVFSATNVIVDDAAGDASWTAVEVWPTLILSSEGGSTTPGETVSVTLTGESNPWIHDTGGEQILPLQITRTDTGESIIFDLIINISPVVPPEGGIEVEGGGAITAPDGVTSAAITITGTDLPEDGIITIDISGLHRYTAAGTCTAENLVVTDGAEDAAWTYSLKDDLLILTSAGGCTDVGERVFIAFTGAVNPWVEDTGGERAVSMNVTRKDSGAVMPLSLILDITPASHPSAGGIAVIGGEKITSRRGNTSVMLTITGTGIEEGGTISIDISALNSVVAGIRVTEANLMVEDTTMDADWAGKLDGYTWILTSNGGPTKAGENIRITFTGSRGNPWIADTGGAIITVNLTAVRGDSGAGASFDLTIETAPGPGGLSTEPGEKITSINGTTTMAITITDAPIPEYDTIVIDLSELDRFAISGILEETNVLIGDTAAHANWSFRLEEGVLILTSEEGDTMIGEVVSVTFTGEVNPWIYSTQGEQVVTLNPVRYDNFGSASFDFTIEISPPPGDTVMANFSASPLTEVVPLNVSFVDTSTGNPTSWEWDFGDGEYSSEHSPHHVYTVPGLYTVSLRATNIYGSDVRTRWNYIHVLDAAIKEANTSIAGLIIPDCEGQQSITVDTGMIPATLDNGNTMLVLTPPAIYGFSNITLFSLDGTGFSENGTLIHGTVTAVQLMTEEASPFTALTGSGGSEASFYFVLEVPSYPCNREFTTQLIGGILPDHETELLKISTGNDAVPIGTAFTTIVHVDGIFSEATVRIRMSLNASWNPSLTGGPGNIFIWRINDEETQGQILPTTFLYHDAETGLDHYEAVSASGFSIFGISSLTGNNNPFQLISLVIQEAAANARGSGSDSDDSGSAVSRAVGGNEVATTVTVAITAPSGEGAGATFAVDEVTAPPVTAPEEVAVSTMDQRSIIEPMRSPSAFGLFLGLLSYMVENPVLLLAMVLMLFAFTVLGKRFRSQRTPMKGWRLSVGKRGRVLAEIEEVMEDIDAQLVDLNAMFERPGFVMTMAEADTIVERFFISCQIAEVLIKKAAVNEQLRREDIERLNSELSVLVQRMIETSHRHVILYHPVMARLEASA